MERTSWLCLPSEGPLFMLAREEIRRNGCAARRTAKITARPGHRRERRSGPRALRRNSASVILRAFDSGAGRGFLARKPLLRTEAQGCESEDSFSGFPRSF